MYEFMQFSIGILALAGALLGVVKGMIAVADCIMRIERFEYEKEMW